LTAKTSRPTWTPGQQEHLNKIKNLLRYAVKKLWKIEKESISLKGLILAVEKKLEAPAPPKESQL
jgi:hypothetical protein